MVYGAFLGALTGLALTALFYLGEQIAGLPFVPFDFFEWLARVTPGNIVSLFIDTMVSVIRGLSLGATADVAKLMEQSLAVGMMVVIGAVFGAVVAAIPAASGWRGSRAGTVGGLILLILAVALEFSAGPQANPVLAILWIGVAFVGWGSLLGTWIEKTSRSEGGVRAPADRRVSRRTFMSRAVVGSLAVALASFGIGRLLAEGRRATGAAQPLPSVAGTTSPPTPPLLVPGRTLQPVPGTRPEVVPNDKFYRIDIDLVPPTIHGDSWAVDVDGLFDKPRRLVLADLMAYPAVTEPRTLSCISNPVGGDLIGNTYWTGLRVPALMKELGLRPEAKGLRIESADGFYETVTMADLADPRTLLVYGMNGETLPIEHGFPLRILIPNRYGMKQPKWITHFTALDRDRLGYWVERGWNLEARPQIVSVIDTVDKDQQQNGRVPIGGIAWAGDRGISKVEVQVDNGPWTDAALVNPPLGPLAWVEWRYDWPAVAGHHTFRVRATDGTGAPQVMQEGPPEPDGATGYHMVTQTI